MCMCGPVADSGTAERKAIKGIAGASQVGDERPPFRAVGVKAHAH